MATVMSNVFIAPELIDQICSYIDISDLLCLMRTSSQMHVASSYRIYHTIAITGLKARQLFATIVSSRKNARLYAGAIRHLTYRGNTTEDAFLGFPMFSNALLKLCHLRALHIISGKSVSRYLLQQLDKTGINRQYETLITSLGPGMDCKKACIWALPLLTSLTVTGDYRLTSLAKCRRLTTLKLEQAIHMADFSNLVHNLLHGHGEANIHLEQLEINLRNGTSDEVALAFIGLAQAFPALVHLTFRMPYLNPLVRILVLLSCFLSNFNDTEV